MTIVFILLLLLPVEEQYLNRNINKHANVHEKNGACIQISFLACAHSML